MIKNEILQPSLMVTSVDLKFKNYFEKFDNEVKEIIYINSDKCNK